MASETRICVLRGWSESYAAAARACHSRRHTHVGLARALELVEAGSAVWERETWTTPRGKERSRTLPAIRIVGARRWRKTLSRDGYSTMAVMQLVPGG